MGFRGTAKATGSSESTVADTTEAATEAAAAGFVAEVAKASDRSAQKRDLEPDVSAGAIQHLDVVVESLPPPPPPEPVCIVGLMQNDSGIDGPFC